jgi:hypothetical protein
MLAISSFFFYQPESKIILGYKGKKIQMNKTYYKGKLMRVI